MFLPISSSVTWTLKLYLVKITIYEAAHYAISCEELAEMIKQYVLLIGNYWQNAGLIIPANNVFLTTLKKLGQRQMMESNGYMP
jgi:hypothetical protein